jgi:hypothetical protein
MILIKLYVLKFKTNLQLCSRLCSMSQISHAHVQKDPLTSYHGYPRILSHSWKKVNYSTFLFLVITWSYGPKYNFISIKTI